MEGAQIIDPILQKLKAYQIAPFQRLLQIDPSVNSTFDLSDCGTGKTYIACAFAKQLARPTLVVCPKIAVTTWRLAAKHFDDSLSVINYESLSTGRSFYGKWDNTPPAGFKNEEYFQCQCCQRPFDLDNFIPCYCHPLGIHCAITKKKKWRYGDFHFHSAIKFLIFDEGHRCGAVDSLNAKMLIAAKRQGIKTHILSATAAIAPIKMQALGYHADLHTITPSQGTGFYQWLQQQGYRRHPAGYGFLWNIGEDKQKEKMAALNSRILSRGVRLRVEDIPDFPEIDISAELYDLNENQSIDALYEEMAEALSGIDETSEHPLTRILRARQKVELLKVPVAVELAEDSLEKGYSVALFVNFKQTMTELRGRLKCDCFIDGSADGVKFRQHSIEDFQANRKRLIIVNNEAGGIAVSLQDLDGNFPRIGYVFPSFSAISMRQLCGRLRREGGKSKALYRFIFAAKTVETKMHRALASKSNNLDALNDADLCPDNFPLKRFSLLT